MTRQEPKSAEISYVVARRILSMQREGEGPTHFAKRIGLTPQTVSNYSKGKNGAGLDAVARVLQKSRDVAAEWLILGLEPKKRVPVAEAESKLTAIERVLSGTPELGGDWVLGSLATLLEFKDVRAKGPDPWHAAIGAMEQLVKEQAEVIQLTWAAYIELSDAAGQYDPEKVPEWTDVELAVLRGLLKRYHDLEAPDSGAFEKDLGGSEGG